jgi:hypothetical protein
MVEPGHHQQGKEGQHHSGTDNLLDGPGLMGRACIHPSSKDFRILHTHINGVDHRQDNEYAEEDPRLPVVERARRPEQRKADQRQAEQRCCCYLKSDLHDLFSYSASRLR